MPTLKKPKYLTTENGKRVGVVLDEKTFDALVDAFEELHDVQVFDRQKPIVDANIRRGEFTTWKDYMTKRKTKSKDAVSNHRR
jgi:hypothetical protein